MVIQSLDDLVNNFGVVDQLSNDKDRKDYEYYVSYNLQALSQLAQTGVNVAGMDRQLIRNAKSLFPNGHIKNTQMKQYKSEIDQYFTDETNFDSTVLKAKGLVQMCVENGGKNKDKTAIEALNGGKLLEQYSQDKVSSDSVVEYICKNYGIKNPVLIDVLESCSNKSILENNVKDITKTKIEKYMMDNEYVHTEDDKGKTPQYRKGDLRKDKILNDIKSTLFPNNYDPKVAVKYTASVLQYLK